MRPEAAQGAAPPQQWEQRQPQGGGGRGPRAGRRAVLLQFVGFAVAALSAFIARAGQQVAAAGLALPQSLVRYEHVGRQVWLAAGGATPPLPRHLLACAQRDDPLVPLAVDGPLRHHRMITYRTRMLSLKHHILQH